MCRVFGEFRLVEREECSVGEVGEELWGRGRMVRRAFSRMVLGRGFVRSKGG